VLAAVRRGKTPRTWKREQSSMAGVLVEPGHDLAGVHLHAVTRDGPAIAPGAFPLEAGSLEPVLAVADEDLVDGVEREPQPVPAGELVPEHLDAELALAAQAQDQRLLLGEDLAVRGGVRPVAARLEADLALGLVAVPPLPERRTGDAAPPADEAGVADPLVEPDPAQSRVRVHGSSPPARPWTCRTTLRVAHDPTAATAATAPTLTRSGQAIAGRRGPGEVERPLRTPDNTPVSTGRRNASLN
jgi:hypothetical protein